MNPREVTSLSVKAIETGLTDLASYLLKGYNFDLHFDHVSSALHAYVVKPGAATPLKLHLYFYYNVDGNAWYCVDAGIILEYGCSISEVPNPDTATETDYVDAQIAKDSIERVIDSYFKAE